VYAGAVVVVVVVVVVDGVGAVEPLAAVVAALYY